MTDGQTFHFIPHIGIYFTQTDRRFISFYPYWNPRMTDVQTFHFILSLILESTYDRRTDISFHFIPHIGFHVWQTDRQHFISFLILGSTSHRPTDNISFFILEAMYDRRTDISFHFIPHIGNHVWQTVRHFISYFILGSTSHRRTDNISFHPLYLNPRMTDGQTFHFIPHIGIHVWQTDRHFISFLILESTYDRRTDISFHFSYLIPCMTDWQTFHFIPYIGIHVWQTDRHFISSLILESMYDRRTAISFHFIPYIGIHVWQTDRHFISFLILESTYDRRTDISFHFIPYIGIHVWQTDRQHFITFLIFESMYDRHFISSLILESMYDRRTDNIHFISHFWIHVWQTDRHFISSLILESMYDRRRDNISFHSSYWNPRMTDGQTTFHFIPHIWIHVWQTDRHFISFLIFESMYGRRTDYISFHPLYWNPCMTDGQTFQFIPHIGFHVWQTDRHFILSLILKSTYDRRTDNISFHPLYWNPCMTDGQTFHFIPHIGIHVWQTDRHFILYLILESTYDRRTDILFYTSYWNPRMTDGQTFHFIPHVGIHVGQTDRHFISFLILESMYDRRTDNISFHPLYWNPCMTDGQTFRFISHIWIHVWQTDRHFISSLILESMYDRRTDNISFHSLYWIPCMTDGQTFHFIPHIGFHVWQTDRHLISSLIFESMYARRTDISFLSSFESMYGRRTDISFHSSYLNPCMTDGQTFHFFPHLNPCMTDGQTFHFIPHIWIHVWQTDRHFISFLIFESMFDRRTDISFHFIPHIWIYVWQTDRHFISFLILESTYDRRTDISFHTSYWNLLHTDGHGQTTFYFIPYIGIHAWQTYRHFISFLILESTYDRRTDNISFHSSYWNPRMTDGQTYHFSTHIGIYVIQTDKLRFMSPSNWNLYKTDRQTDKLRFISSIILESKLDRQTN